MLNILFDTTLNTWITYQLLTPFHLENGFDSDKVAVDKHRKSLIAKAQPFRVQHGMSLIQHHDATFETKLAILAYSFDYIN